MTGHVRKRGSSWEVVLELGEQAAQRCPVCMAKRGRNGGRLIWVDKGRRDACPACGGELEDMRCRRQITLPERYPTKREASDALTRRLNADLDGVFVEPDKITVGEYLEKRWLPSLAAQELSPSTIVQYELHVARVLPAIRDIPLQKLTRSDVALVAADLAKKPTRKTGKPLSPSTRSGALVILQRALGDAVESGLLRVNPAAGVKRPKVRRPEIKAWSSDELATFLRATRDDQLGPLWHVLGLTGLRRGEALGLYWPDVDLDAGRLHVQRQRAVARYVVSERPTKNGKPRPISLDAGTVEALRRQSQRQLDDAAEWGDAWTATGHVFTREDGEPWHPDKVSEFFRATLKRVDVPRIRVHDLRHTWATLALRAGVHPKVVQERLGHANIRITLDTYSHVLPDMQESAAELVAALVDVGEG